MNYKYGSVGLRVAASELDTADAWAVSDDLHAHVSHLSPTGAPGVPEDVVF